MTGTVRKLVREKGFGFIVEAGKSGTKPAGDYFFHRSGCQDHDGFDTLNEGDAVDFDPVSKDELDRRDQHKGPRAHNVRPSEPAA